MTPRFLKLYYKSYSEEYSFMRSCAARCVLRPTVHRPATHRCTESASIRLSSLTDPRAGDENQPHPQTRTLFEAKK